MRLRIAIWAGMGFLVAAGWALYAFLSFPSRPITPAEPFVWNLALVTQPIAFASVHYNFPLSMYWVAVANAATYALVGLIVESLRRQLKWCIMLGDRMP
jgi:hypothetical protein